MALLANILQTNFMNTFKEALKSPEWWAFIALSIQAAILLLHAVILHKHSKALERNVEIADTQASTQQTIAQALLQQGTILQEQAKIMDSQFQFQKKFAEDAEKQKVFGLVYDVYTRFIALCDSAAGADPRAYTEPYKDRVLRSYGKFNEALVLDQKALITSSLPFEKREYFFAFISGMGGVKINLNPEQDAKHLESVRNTYTNFPDRFIKAMQG